MLTLWSACFTLDNIIYFSVLVAISCLQKKKKHILMLVRQLMLFNRTEKSGKNEMMMMLGVTIFIESMTRGERIHLIINGNYQKVHGMSFLVSNFDLNFPRDKRNIPHCSIKLYESLSRTTSQSY